MTWNCASKIVFFEENDWNALAEEGPGRCQRAGKAVHQGPGKQQQHLRALHLLHLLGDVPLGTLLLMMLQWEMWVPVLLLPGFSAVPCGFKANAYAGLQKVQFESAGISLSPRVLQFLYLLSPCFILGFILGRLFVWHWKEQPWKKSCIPNTFQVCAKITREQNSANKHFLEFLCRQGMYFFPAVGLEKSSTHSFFCLLLFWASGGW